MVETELLAIRDSRQDLSRAAGQVQEHAAAAAVEAFVQGRVLNLKRKLSSCS